MSPRTISPFDSIESAQEFLILLSEVVVESEETIRRELNSDAELPGRQLEALRLTMYKLESLSRHLKSSRRILNDLHMLRRILRQS